MKRVMLLFLVLVLCTALPACGEKTQTERPNKTNPIIGIWKVKTPDREQSFTFTNGSAGTEGSFQYYDYADSSWGEYTFTVKEQTGNSLTLLIDDGTLDELRYKVVGKRLYLDGFVYTKNTATVPTLQSIKSIEMVYDGDDYLIYEQLFMGIYVEDAEEILDQSLSLEESGISNDYDYDFTCDYSADLTIDNGIYYNLRLGFDDSKRLVHLTKQGHYDDSSFNSLKKGFTAEFGEPTYSQNTWSDSIRNSLLEYYTWAWGDYNVELTTGTYEGEQEPAYVTVRYWYNPA